MYDVYTLSCDALPSGARVIAFRGAERISDPYEFRIDLLVPHVPDFDAGKLLGARAGLVIDRHDGRMPLPFHGILVGADLAFDIERGDVYRVVLVPQLYRLTHSRQSRVFVDSTLPEILDATLRDGGLAADDYELRLSGAYKPIEHVCQYEESHFAFFSRWLEREGLYYFFEQHEKREKLVITDSQGFQSELSPDPVRFMGGRAAGAAAGTGEAIDWMTVRHQALPTKVKFRDYDYQRPDLDVSGSAAVAAHGVGEQRIFGNNFSSPDEGKRLATIVSQALQVGRTTFEASGNALHLRPGFFFALDEHPRSNFNARYLVTSLEHVGNQMAHALGVADVLGYEADELYRCHLTAVSDSVQFRAKRRTPWPRIDGTVSAVVDGAADHDYAQIDKHGRYRVKLQFDEGDLKDGKASMWVRMMQPHGGSPEGFHFPLRKGTEVLITFLGGDPDQPVIAGVVPNAKNPSPVTEDNHTKNVIHTGGGNQLVMEDHESKRSIKLRTPHMNTMLHLGAPNSPAEGFHLRTDANGQFYVKKDLSTDVMGKSDTKVTGSSSLSAASISESAKTVDITASGNRTDTSDNHFVNAQSVWVDAKQKFQIVATDVIDYSDTFTVQAGKSVTVTCWGTTISMDHDTIKLSVGSSSIELTANEVKIVGSKVSIHAPGEVDVKGSPIKLNS